MIIKGKNWSVESVKPVEKKPEVIKKVEKKVVKETVKTPTEEVEEKNELDELLSKIDKEK